MSIQPIAQRIVDLARERKFLRRLLVYIAGLFICAFGVAFAINSDLGLSPINSFPFVVSQITGIRMGLCLTVLLVFFMLLQIVILRREFKWINLAQILFANIFGPFVDLSRLILGDLQIPTYVGQLGMLGISIVLIAVGITLYIDAQLMALPAEALVIAIAYKINSKFHRVKIVMDCIVVGTAILLSLIFLREFHGVREGTVLSAVLVGKLMPWVSRMVGPVLCRIGIKEAEITE